VLLLSQYVESRYALQLLQSYPGGIGYLLKERVFDIATVLDAHVSEVFAKLGLDAEPSTNRRVLAALAYLKSAPVQDP
jgi:hypothetical protein